MTIQDHTFNTLTAYLEWLEQEWYTFEEKLYALEDYLGFGQYMWTEVYCLPKEKTE
jgi:hypothetical protein